MKQKKQILLQKYKNKQLSNILKNDFDELSSIVLPENKQKLGLLVLGQLRTFFSKNLYVELSNLLVKWATLYDVYIIFVINDKYVSEQFNCFKEITFKQYLIDYTKYGAEYDSYAEALLNNENYRNMKNEYMTTANDAHKEVTDTDRQIKISLYQMHQLYIGIQQLKKIEKDDNICFDIIMKTRFDVEYSTNFVPLMKNDAEFIEKINLTKHNLAIFKNSLVTHNLTEDNFIDFLKNKKIVAPKCRIVEDYRFFSFGGMYMYNYVSLENILNNPNCDNILYAYNDHFYFGNRNTFYKLETMIHTFGNQPCKYNINYYFAQESQLLIHCLNNDVNILMFLNNTHTIIR